MVVSRRLPATLALLALLFAGAATTRADEQTRIQQAVDALRPEVAELRGLAWKRPVPATLLTHAQLLAFLQAEMDRDETPAQWKRDDRILHRLGLLQPDEDLRTLVLKFQTGAIAGLYDPVTKKLYVVQGVDFDSQRPTMVHELIHALDDQTYDLRGMEEPYRDDDPDREFAIRCLWEGCAEYGRRLYQDRHPEVARHFYDNAGSDEDEAAQEALLKVVPAFMVVPSLLHYRTGPHFVTQRLARDGYAAGMQALFADPPRTEEQVLHPERWLGPRRDLPRIVHWGPHLAAALGPGWTKLDEHSVGELDLALYLDAFLGDLHGRIDERAVLTSRFVDARSSRAARGWDAGRALYYEDGQGHIVVAQAFAFDTPEDAEEAARLLGAARRVAYGKDWKGNGWPKQDAVGESVWGFDYRGTYGRGRIVQRGHGVLLLDGAPDEVFEQAWKALAQTTFEKQAGDAGDDLPDAFAGCAVVDRRRGLGLKLPGAGWTAEPGQASPYEFAVAVHGQVQVHFTVLDTEVSQAGLPGMGRMFLGPVFRAASLKPSSMLGRKGLVQPLPARPGWVGRAHFVSDAVRTYAVTVTGPQAEVAAVQGDVARLLAGLPGPLARGAAARREGGEPPAGLVSIPGY